MRRVTVLLVVTCALLSSGSPAAADGADGSRLAGTPLEAVGCPVPTPDAARVECGWLTVPESRQRPDGRQIRLLVAVVHASAAPSRPPVLVTAGGPGASSTGLLGLAGSAYTRDRDLVVLEQRGTGYSEPSLQCPEVEAALTATLTRADPVEEETAAEVGAALACADRLLGEGIDLASYTTAENAADVADLRGALGFPEWDLWGLSYSTRLALTVLRDHPEGVRSVVLDSAVPTDVAQYDVQVASLAEAHARLAADCAALTACADAYPDPVGALAEAAARLDADPLPVEAVSPRTGEPVRLQLTGDDLVSAVFTSLYDPSTLRYAPLLVDRFAARDADAVTPVADAALEELTGYALGMYYSVQCAEKAPLTEPGAAARDGGALPGRPATHLLWLGSDPEVCRAWPVPPRPEAAAPVRSDVPVLVLGGRYDPVTPPDWGRQVAASLPRATFVELPGQGHTPSLQGDCAPGIVLDFLADPERTPKTSCLDDLEPPDVVLPAEVHLTPGVYRLAGEVERGAGTALVSLGAALLGLLLGTGGLLRALVRRPRRGGRRAPARLALAAAGLDLVAVAGLAWLVADTAARDQLLLGFGLPPVGTVLLLLPAGGAVLAGAALVLLAGRRRAGPGADVVPVVLAAASALGLMAVLTAVGLTP